MFRRVPLVSAASPPMSRGVAIHHCHPEAAAEGSVAPLTAFERILRFAQDDNRRWGIALLGFILVLTACAPPTASPPAATSLGAGAPGTTGPAAAEMEQLVAAARKEGTLAINVQPAQPLRDWVAEFAKKYPFLNMEQGGLSGNDFVARALGEQRAGQFLWDVHLGGPDSGYSQLVPAEALDPVAPAVILPEILDDSKWFGGFAGGFADAVGKYVYVMQAEVVHPVWVNRDFVPEAQLSRVEELADPKWSGKVSIFDPRVAGAGAVTGGHLVLVNGSDFWRQLLIQTQPVATLDRRQQVEWLVRGRYPIAIAPDSATLTQFRKEGIAGSVRVLAPETPAGSRLLHSFSVMLPTKGPHPNAAKLFINWALSRDGQDLLQKLGNTGSRRLDLSEVTDIELPDARVTYPPALNKEAFTHHTVESISVAKDVLK